MGINNKVKIMRVIKSIGAIIMFVFGFYALKIWVVGSHDHILDRPWEIGNWIMFTIVLICWGVPLYYIYKVCRRWVSKKHKL
jgi:hypothetical protein